MATKLQLEAAKREQEIIQVRRKARLAAWNDYIGFGMSKATGLAGVICGGLDIFNPNLIPHIPHPEYVVGGGFALLTGKSMVNLFSKILQGLG